MIPHSRTLTYVAGIACAGSMILAPADAAAQTDRTAASSTPVVEVTATDYAFEAPDEIRSGWTTIRFRNEGTEHHFLLFNRLPEGRTYDDYVVEVGAPFNDVWYELRAGAIGRDKVVPELVEALPEWFWSVQQFGGPGLQAPGGRGETTIRLEPGNYVIECYVKTAEGEFHGMEGMVRPLIVRSEDGGDAPPSPDATLTITNAGMSMDRVPAAGLRTVAVHFKEHPEGGFPHDAHLARVEDGTDLDALAAWIDWITVEGLKEPAPAAFVGGAQEMPAGHTAYVTVRLEPGDYAWLSEASGSAGIRKAFTVR
jgi:hypothetical protein